MSGFQLVASLVGALAWPVVITLGVFAAWVKRDEVAELLTSNGVMAGGRKLRRIKAGPIEVEWEELIRSTTEDIDQAVPNYGSVRAGKGEEFSVPPQSGKDAPKSYPSGNLPSDAVRPISSAVPTAVVLEEFSRIESRLREMLRDAGEQPPLTDATTTLSQRALKLGLISSDLARVIDNLARLRNEAAHRVGQDDISTYQARQYLELSERVLGGLGVRTGNAPKRVATFGLVVPDDPDLI